MGKHFLWVWEQLLVMLPAVTVTSCVKLLPEGEPLLGQLTYLTETSLSFPTSQNSKHGTGPGHEGHSKRHQRAFIEEKKFKGAGGWCSQWLKLLTANTGSLTWILGPTGKRENWILQVALWLPCAVCGMYVPTQKKYMPNKEIHLKRKLKEPSSTLPLPPNFSLFSS